MAQYDVNLRDYWRILPRRKGIVLFTATFIGFLNFIMANIWAEVPEYKARAKVQLNADQSPESLYAQAMNAYNGGTDPLETQEAIITSFPVIKRVGEKLGRFARESPSAPFTAEDSIQVILGLQRLVKTQQSGDANIINIEIIHRDKNFARNLANIVAETYKEYDYEQKGLEKRKKYKFIKKMLDEKRAILHAKEESVKTFRENENLVSLQAQTGVLLGQLTGAERNVQELKTILKDILNLRNAMHSEKDFSTNVIQGAARSQVGETFMGLSDQLNGLNLRKDALLVKFTLQHPQVKEIKAQIDQLEENLANDLEQRIQGVERELVAEQRRLDQFQQELNELPAKGLELERRMREADIATEVVVNVEDEYQKALVGVEGTPHNITITEPAVTPGGPINTNQPINRALLGVLLGLIIGIIIAVVMETMDTSIGTIEDVQEYTGAQVLGIVPLLDVDGLRASLRRRGAAELDEETLERKAQLVAFFAPQSSLAENYRTLRTNIEFVTVEKGAKTLMVTSSMHQEGKSTTISNLAMTMAQLGKQTLLVDCDLRRPTLPSLFGLDKEPGLTEVIVGNYRWRDVVRTVTDIVTGGMGMEDILQTQRISNLNILTSGAIPPNPAELLNSTKMEEFVDEISESYDIVLFDSPPLLHVADAAILGKKLDGAVMVYKAGDIPRTSLKRSVGLLTSVQIEVFGIVLNGIRSDISADFQELGNYGYYAYGSELEKDSRTIQERIQDYVYKIKKKVGLGSPFATEEVAKPEYEVDDEPGEYDEDEVVEEDEMDAGEDEFGDEEFEEDEDAGGEDNEGSAGDSALERGRLAWNGSRGGGVLLALIAVMLVWQSGYLVKPLGLVPILEDYEAVVKVEERGEQVVPEELGEILPEVEKISSGVENLGEISQPGAQVAEDEFLAVPTGQSDEVVQVEKTGALSAEETVQLQAETRAGVYAIRVASYPADSERAIQQLKRLRENNQAAFLNPVTVQSQQWKRLLVGSFATLDETYERGRQLRQQGLINEFVIERLPYAIELELYRNFALARKAVETLQGKGYSTYWQLLPNGSGRVLAGAFETDVEARAFLREISAVNGPAQVVMR